MDVSVEKVFLWNEPTTACFRIELSNSMCADYTLTYYSVTDLNILSFQMWKRKTSKKNSMLPFWIYFTWHFLNHIGGYFSPLLKFNLSSSPVLRVQILQFSEKKGQKTNFPVLHFNWHWNVICQPSSYPENGIQVLEVSFLSAQIWVMKNGTYGAQAKILRHF